MIVKVKAGLKVKVKAESPSAQAEEEDFELREYCLQALESFVERCPLEMSQGGLEPLVKARQGESSRQGRVCSRPGSLALRAKWAAGCCQGMALCPSLLLLLPFLFLFPAATISDMNLQCRSVSTF